VSAARRPLRSRPSGTTPLAPAPAPLIVGDQTPAPDQQTHGVTESRSNRVPDSQSPGVTEPQGADKPRYLRLVRKEARVRHDQADALARLRRRIAADRTDRTEPLTDNTLVRVALDVLLLHADALTGDTEEQLLESLTHRLRDSVSR
jgi:hypothetical protein